MEFAGISHASGYDFDSAQIARITGAKLFLSRATTSTEAATEREWDAWATAEKKLTLVPGNEHGTDLLRNGNPLRARVESVIIRFLSAYAPAS